MGDPGRLPLVRQIGMPILSPEGIAEVGLVARVVGKLIKDDSAARETRDTSGGWVDLELSKILSESDLILRRDVSGDSTSLREGFVGQGLTGRGRRQRLARR